MNIQHSLQWPEMQPFLFHFHIFLCQNVWVFHFRVGGLRFGSFHLSPKKKSLCLHQRGSIWLACIWVQKWCEGGGRATAQMNSKHHGGNLAVWNITGTLNTQLGIWKVMVETTLFDIPFTQPPTVQTVQIHNKHNISINGWQNTQTWNSVGLIVPYRKQWSAKWAYGSWCQGWMGGCQICGAQQNDIRTYKWRLNDVMPGNNGPGCCEFNPDCDTIRVIALLLRICPLQIENLIDPGLVPCAFICSNHPELKSLRNAAHGNGQQLVTI